MSRFSRKPSTPGRKSPTSTTSLRLGVVASPPPKNSGGGRVQGAGVEKAGGRLPEADLGLNVTW